MKPALVRTAVLSGTTLLALGIAGPALACIDTASSGAVDQARFSSYPQGATPRLTLAEYQAKVDARLAKTLARLAEAKTSIADSTKLTDVEKSAKTARIDDLVATIDALRAQVAADTSIDAIKADVKAAFAPDVDDVKASLDARLARWIAKIDAWQLKIAADASIDPAKKADKLAKLQAWEDKLVALRAEIAAATTLDEVKADLKAANLRGLGLVGEHGSGRYGSGHHDGHSDEEGLELLLLHEGRDETSTLSFRQ